MVTTGKQYLPRSHRVNLSRKKPTSLRNKRFQSVKSLHQAGELNAKAYVQRHSERAFHQQREKNQPFFHAGLFARPSVDILRIVTVLRA